MYNRITNHEVIRDQFNKRFLGPVYWKLQSIFNWNVEIYCIHVTRFHSVLLDRGLPPRAISVKIPASFIVQIHKMTLQLTWKFKRPKVAKIILGGKKNKFGGLTLPHFETYFKATVTKAMWYWCHDRKIDLWNRIKSSKIHHTYIAALVSSGCHNKIS